MKICRFDDDRLGVVKGGMVHDVTSVLDGLPPFRMPFPRHDPFIERLDTLRPLMEAAAAKAPGRPLAQVRLLPPVMNPGKTPSKTTGTTNKTPTIHGGAAISGAASVPATQSIHQPEARARPPTSRRKVNRQSRGWAKSAASICRRGERGH
jgi:hypothetical protein